MRVVSLVPSATELLCAMGAADLLVGRSHECDSPDSIHDIPVLTKPRTTATDAAAIDAEVAGAMETHGSLYVLDADALKALAPDVVLLQDTCSVCSIDVASVETVLSQLPTTPAVLTLNPHSIEDIFDDLIRIGDAVGRPEAAQRTLIDMRAVWWDTQDVVNPYVDGPRTVVLEWADPLYVAGHWTPQLITAAGGCQNLVAPGAPSRIVDPEELLAEQVDRLIIAPCGVPLKEAHAQLELLQQTRWWPLLPAVAEGGVALVDGTSSFSRPGPRLLQTHRWLTGWLQDRPELVPADFAWERVPST
jgi:iron complex transport system substrate-binding protein